MKMVALARDDGSQKRLLHLVNRIPHNICRCESNHLSTAMIPVDLLVWSNPSNNMLRIGMLFERNAKERTYITTTKSFINNMCVSNYSVRTRTLHITLAPSSRHAAGVRPATTSTRQLD